MSTPTLHHELIFIISSLPNQQEWMLLHGPVELGFRDRNQGKVPGLVDAIRHAFFTADGRPSLLLIQHGGRQFRLRFHAEGLLEGGPVPTPEHSGPDFTAWGALCGAS